MNFFFMNLFISVILENFYDKDYGSASVEITQGDVDDFKRIWSRFDPNATQFIPVQALPKYVDSSYFSRRCFSNILLLRFCFPLLHVYSVKHNSFQYSLRTHIKNEKYLWLCSVRHRMESMKLWHQCDTVYCSNRHKDVMQYQPFLHNRTFEIFLFMSKEECRLSPATLPLWRDLVPQCSIFLEHSCPIAGFTSCSDTLVKLDRYSMC